MRGRAAAIAVLLVALLGSQGNALARSDRPAARAGALRTADVPRGFKPTLDRYWTADEVVALGTWSRAKLHRWGYRFGFERQFDRDVDGADPAQLSSDVGVYGSSHGAALALAANGDRCARDRWKELHRPSGFGRDAHLCTVTGRQRGVQGRIYFVAWRYKRFKGSVTLSALQGRYHSGDAVRLARRQAARMRRSLS